MLVRANSRKIVGSKSARAPSFFEREFGVAVQLVSPRLDGDVVWATITDRLGPLHDAASRKTERLGGADRDRAKAGNPLWRDMRKNLTA